MAEKNWKEVSPDLSRETWELPSVVDDYKNSAAAKATRRGVIYALGLSPLDGTGAMGPAPMTG